MNLSLTHQDRVDIVALIDADVALRDADDPEASSLLALRAKLIERPNCPHGCCNDGGPDPSHVIADLERELTTAKRLANEAIRLLLDAAPALLRNDLHIVDEFFDRAVEKLRKIL